MKGIKSLIFLLIFLGCTQLFGQSETMTQYASDHYRIYTDVSDSYGKELADKMEAALVLFNKFLNFNISSLETKFKVVIYNSKTDFDDHLVKLLGQSREDFVYIHYSDQLKSELVGFYKTDINSLDISLLHQGFIQFLKAFIPNAPIWLSEGMAAYLESSTYSGNPSQNSADDGVSETTPSDTSTTQKQFTLNKSLSWLDNLKSILNGSSGVIPYKVEDLITLDRTQAVSNLNVFYPQAWGLVYFLLNSDDKDYNRMIWDSISYLDPSLSLAENSSLLKTRVFSRVSSSELNTDYKDFISSQKTFYELVTEGIEFYNNSQFSKALEYFLKALDLKPSNFYPSYYLGLTYYALKDYYKAETYYNQAIQNGADQALTYYAMGVNAYADNNYNNASTYLSRAVDLDSEKYEQKAQIILELIASESPGGM